MDDDIKVVGDFSIQEKVVPFLIALLVSIIVGESLEFYNDIFRFISMFSSFIVSKYILDKFIFKFEEPQYAEQINRKLILGWVVIFILFWTAIGINLFKNYDKNKNEGLIKDLYKEELAKLQFRDKLYKAIEENKIQYIENFLKKGGDPNIVLKGGDTALHIASKYGRIEIMKLLLDYGADPNIRNDNLDTPLIYATSEDQLKAIKLLIKYKADPNIPNIEGDTPLHIAVRKKYPKAVELLYYYGAWIDSKNVKGLTPVDIAQNLLDKSMSRYFLYIFSLDLNNPQDKFNLAVRVNDIELVKNFLKNGIVNPNLRFRRGLTALHIASYRDYLELAKLLIEHRADVNIKSKKGLTPLHLASLRGNLDIIKLLHEHGAYINARDNQGFIPLHLAISSKNIKVIKYLVKHGANTNAKNNLGRVPLYYSVFYKDKVITEYLLKHKANPNIPDRYHRTPLHYAVIWDLPQLAIILIKYGAKTNIRDIYGFTPEDYARASSNSEIFYLITNKK